MEEIFDSHAHYDDKAFDPDREALLASFPGEGVCAAVNVGCDLASSRASIALAERYSFIWAAVGVHPENAGEAGGDWLGELSGLLSAKRAVALGEIGLDYHYDTPDRETQKRVFEAQLRLAAERGIPVIIHSRDAAEDTMSLLRRYRPKGVMHCFSGSVETAKEALSMGLHLGFTGVVSFKNARRAKEAAAIVPPDRLLLETDCPYMAPEPFRGRRSDSTMIPHTASAIAAVRGVSPQEVLLLATENARRLFDISG